MFKPKITKIKKIYNQISKPIKELEKLFNGRIWIYIDYANIRPWSDKIKFHIDFKRLKQFIDSFDNIEISNFYQWILKWDEKSEEEWKEIEKAGFNFVTKPVKIMKFSIDTSSINKSSPILINQFIKNSLLRKLKIEDIEHLNSILTDMNNKWQKFIEDRKCNFDVEIGVDMLIDLKKDNVDTFVLWSWDSDFVYPLKKVLDSWKKVILFATSWKVSKELNELREDWLIIFDIKKIKYFICWKREIDKNF